VTESQSRPPPRHLTPLQDLMACLCGWLMRRLPPKEVGRLFEALQIDLADPRDPRIGAYALEFNNPQALCFLIDAYPKLQQVFARYPRLGSIRFLDIGPAFGASAGLLSEMHRSHFLGPRLEVEVLDIVDTRQAFIELSYPQLRFLHGDIHQLPPEAIWDVVYCSNVIEHMEQPGEFISAVLSHTRGQAVFLAPYREAAPMSPGHHGPITEQTFEGFAGFRVDSVCVFPTAAWPTTADGVERQQILAVLSAV
jgi:hypothetical protein